jgi:tetratricopeptide (TPR) repeat protein
MINVSIPNAKERPPASLLKQLQVLAGEKNYQAALALLAEENSQDLNNAEVCNIAGACAFSVGELVQAEHYWRRALAIKPNYYAVSSDLGVLLEKLGQLAEAENCYRQALNVKPNFAEAHCNLGDLYEQQKRFSEAETCYRQALQYNPHLAEVHGNLGNMYLSLRRLSEAEASYRQALAIKPDYANADWGLSQVLLLRGEFAEGWRRHEARYQAGFIEPNTFPPRHLSFPQWQGQSLLGKSILIWTEQGYGDQIQFCRYAAELKSQGAKRVTIVCAAALVTLFKSLAQVDAVMSTEAAGAKLKQHDYWVLILSLPFYCGTRLETIPAVLPYLHAEKKLIRKWSAVMPKCGLRVGLVWKGSKTHKNDVQRSLPSLQTLASLWHIPDLVFISLQKGQGEDEAANPPPTQALLHLGGKMADFADAAAIISQLDLVICVDTAAAHLAGALQRPCWVLLPWHNADWRWLLDRNDSPWYPGVLRLFQQQVDGDWTAVVNEVAWALQSWRLDQLHSGGPLRQKSNGIVGNLLTLLGVTSP